MAERSRGFLLYIRRWHLRRQATITLVCCLLWLLFPQRLYDVPARDGVQGALWPLIPAIFSTFLPPLFGNADGVQERLAPHPARLRFVTVCLVVAMGAVLATSGAWIDVGVAVRNTLLVTGLALYGAWLLPAGAAWTPPVLVPIVMWLVGTKPHGLAEGWAVLLQPSTAAYTWMPAVVVSATGAFGYVWSGPRTWSASTAGEAVRVVHAWSTRTDPQRDRAGSR
ncbi:hypothetical protein AQJ43_36780 [Streptomyces avermitilis]|uniref:Uncharacterized protein n=2 Tax=Streptomyces avermitilis TaxID=33903 RepID=A0A143T0E7_STRAW|nr:hypothetical protein AQJ43_36780 [Streptomyces avermitilis]BAU77483.1 hypothetical protein SAVERM_2p039 [Streptomyces avermitilis MA-4680 = NBRC 14893]BBJ56300.1 hypothetical protein SAVMC3_89290 [Streptomyces avermitilis]GDY70153.1 hypothetical protein SAV14893_095460 [Streptomyces avermitilis]GDY80450.1 hypothetical protein SAV31267_099350 [Streptomyces avermitilis]